MQKIGEILVSKGYVTQQQLDGVMAVKGEDVQVVRFGDPNLSIKRDDPARRKSFRARHNCDNPGPRHKARYWSCRKW